MNILITGYNGFIGTNLTKNLTEHSLIGVDLFQSDLVNKHINWQDINDVRNIDYIIHLAGKAHDSKNTTNESEYANINVGLTKRIFDVFLKSDAHKFIFFSSVKAVADIVTSAYLIEETIPNPLTPYGISKLHAEQYILNQPLTNDKKVYILRPCMIHGPGNKGNLNLLYKFAKIGLPWPLGVFENKRSFTSINNLLFILRQLIEKDIEPGIYQVADDQPLSTNELINLIADSLDKKAKIWRISPTVIKLSVKIGDFFGLPFNSESLKKLTESYIVSNQKLKNALKIEKMPVTAMDGLKMTIESFKKRNT